MAVRRGFGRLLRATLSVTLVTTGLILPPLATGPASAGSAPAGVATRVAAGVDPVGAGAFTPVPGARLLDTRSDPAGRLTADVVHVLQVTGQGGVPAQGVAAVVLTVTATGPTGTGFVAVYPGDADYPGTSTVNFVAGQTVANTAVVSLSGAGQVSLRDSGAPVHLVVDVTGWYTAGDSPVPGGFVPVAPARLVDTRRSGTPLRGATPQSVPVAGLAGVPAGAAAAVINLTGIGGATGTTLTAWAAGAARPATSVLNLIPRTVTANLVVVELSGSGAFALAASGGVTDIVIDLVGYLSPGSSPATAGGTVAVAPHRVLDTRSMGRRQPLTSGQAVEVHPSASAAVPVAGVVAVVLTITTASSSVSGGYVTAWASGTARPGSSVLNPRRDRPVAGTVVVGVGADGGVDLYSLGGPTHLVVDVVGYVVAVAPTVAPVDWSTMDTQPLAGGPAGLARQILLTANRYALSVWWPGAAQTLLARPLDSHAPDDSTDAIRRLSMQAMSLAIALRTGAYDASTVGTPAGTARSVAAALIDRVAGAHLANRSGGWGDSWQSALWSSLVGRAGWLLWDDLAPDTRQAVARMVEWEADQSLLPPIAYLRDRTGQVLHPGDTDAEEDAWYALAPALATAMFPDSPHWTAWRQRQEQLQIAAWSRPVDTGSGTVVDGRALRTWLGGSNVEPNGSVINHNRVAPDYSTNAYENLDTVFLAALSGHAAPESTLTGLGPVYHALSSLRFPAPPYRSPGGTVYTSGSSTVYYPQGCDWGTGQQLPYALLDAQAAVFGFGPSDAAAGQSGQHATAEANMQGRTSTGASYLSPSSEYYYVGREEHSAQLAAQLYLTYFVQRLGFRIAPSVSIWSAGAAPAGQAPASVSGDHLTPGNERNLGAH